MVSLLALYVVFVIGVDMTSSIDACVVVAVLLHYLCLSTVFLMGAEAFTMFYLFVSVKGQQGGIRQIKNYVIKIATVAWGELCSLNNIMINEHKNILFFCKFKHVRRL